MNHDSRFLYVHDPMCSWCWGHRPVWDQFEQALAELVPVEYVVGGLAPDSDVPMPEAQQAAISGYWKKIESLLNVPFNHEFWTKNTPRRSTYPACRAVLAARWQKAERAMITALQEAYYQRALNPSDTEVHLQLAGELGLDVDKFEQDLASDALEQAFQDELAFAHSLPIQGFPSMVLLHRGDVFPVPLDYKNFQGALSQVREILNS